MVNAISPEAAADQIRLTAYTVGMAVGEKHTLLLKRDGTVMAAGWNQSGQTEVPDRLVDVVAVAAGSDHSLALRADGRVVAWGWNQAHQTEVPADLEEVVAIAAGREFSLALQKNGAVRAWGGVLPGADGNANEGGAYEPPEELETPPWPLKPGFSPVVAITAGWRHALALRQDGTVLGWGLRSERAAYTPPTNLGPVVAISAGKGFSLALKPDGTVRAWGSNGYHQLDVPPTACHVVAIASGSYHACALREDGTVVVWGDNSVGQTTVPSGLRNVAAIAAGGFGCEVLIQMQPRMAGVRVVNGRFYCDLNLPAGQPYRIEGSLDLIHWETVDLDVARPGWLEWQSMSRSQGGVFYRLAPLGFRFDDGPMKVGWPNAVSRFPLR
jgi:alpha-tubulin suppressor-like RCC1 family protein